MEDSILKSTKMMLGLDPTYTAFDLEVMTHINNAFSSLTQLGVGLPVGFMIEDASASWDDYNVPLVQKSIVRTYVFLKVKIVFDPPTSSYVLTAYEKQIAEQEWRLNFYHETTVP